MAKSPSNLPEAVGDRVRLRANSARTGTVNEVTPRKWFGVTWDDGMQRPKLCHQFELVALPIDGSVKVGV